MTGFQEVHDPLRESGVCVVCFSVVPIKDLRKHILSHKSEKAKKVWVKDKLCPHCGQGFARGFELKEHIARAHETPDPSNQVNTCA